MSITPIRTKCDHYWVCTLDKNRCMWCGKTEDGTIDPSVKLLPYGHDESCEADWDYGVGQVSPCRCGESREEGS